MVSRSIYGVSGGWDEEYEGWGGEDFDFTNRLYGSLHDVFINGKNDGVARIKEGDMWGFHLYHEPQSLTSSKYRIEHGSSSSTDAIVSDIPVDNKITTEEDDPSTNILKK